MVTSMGRRSMSCTYPGPPPPLASCPSNHPSNLQPLLGPLYQAPPPGYHPGYQARQQFYGSPVPQQQVHVEERVRSRSPRSRDCEAAENDIAVPSYPDDGSRLSTAYKAIGMSWIHGVKHVVARRFRMSLIESCAPTMFPCFKLSQLEECELDCLLFLVCGILLNTRVADLNCPTKGFVRRHVPAMHRALIKCNPQRLQMLTEELSTVVGCDLRNGFPSNLLPPGLPRACHTFEAPARPPAPQTRVPEAVAVDAEEIPVDVIEEVLDDLRKQKLEPRKQQSVCGGGAGRPSLPIGAAGAPTNASKVMHDHVHGHGAQHPGTRGNTEAGNPTSGPAGVAWSPPAMKGWGKDSKGALPVVPIANDTLAPSLPEPFSEMLQEPSRQQPSALSTLANAMAESRSQPDSIAKEIDAVTSLQAQCIPVMGQRAVEALAMAQQ